MLVKPLADIQVNLLVLFSVTFYVDDNISSQKRWNNVIECSFFNRCEVFRSENLIPIDYQSC
ncbi:hypothetical protein MADA3029_1070154 [Vibrio nigripulchritudo MADA3029]|nr:hypothetical protein VIBNIMADA3020_410022 [Vibrio nigripulchritudo MADA3020]CCN55882.1 hypothetical protein VIBNIMADA3021_840153 [Vibrio nigripulchritudo MADA3021]CCN57106.1 hypothetical protein MADA3029_1070154 [Vibrio nigripulchritudo MADA3029]